MIVSTPPSEARLAARAVALQEKFPATERKALLAMLGLTDINGRLTEEPAGGVTLASINSAKGTSALAGPTNRRFVPENPSVGRERWAHAIPEGLRNYDPVAAEKAELRKTPQSRTRSIPRAQPELCGSLAGRSRHQKRGEKLCDACRITYNQYQADSRKKREAARKGVAA